MLSWVYVCFCGYLRCMVDCSSAGSVVFDSVLVLGKKFAGAHFLKVY